MAYFFTAAGLVLVAEGLLYGGFPNIARRLAAEVAGMPESTLRVMGVAAMAAGVFWSGWRTGDEELLHLMAAVANPP